VSPAGAADREARMLRAAEGRRSLEGVPRVRRTAARTKPVRTTVDLSPELHRKLKTWTARAAERLDVVEVPLADVFRVLIKRLVEERELEDQVVADLRDGMQ
jgi:hypothetical protein